MLEGNVGRGEKIRTSGPCLPKAVLYQAELHPETGGNHTLRRMDRLARAHISTRISSTPAALRERAKSWSAATESCPLSSFNT